MDDDVRDPAGAAERVPWPQALMDDPFLLLLGGLVVPTLLLIVWGLIELASLEPFVP
jgi:hypothetical protein